MTLKALFKFFSGSFLDLTFYDDNYDDLLREIFMVTFLAFLSLIFPYGFSSSPILVIYFISFYFLENKNSNLLSILTYKS